MKKMTKSAVFLLFSATILFALASCLTSSDPVASTSGFYDLTAYDSTGTKIATGWLQLDFKKKPDVSGFWKLSQVSEESQPKLPVGVGNLRGRLEGENISLDLHPNMVDNNIILTGTLKEGTIRGEWSWITFAGISDKGTFVAQKR